VLLSIGMGTTNKIFQSKGDDIHDNSHRAHIHLKVANHACDRIPMLEQKRAVVADAVKTPLHRFVLMHISRVNTQHTKRGKNMEGE
jgi:hypothetical protein